MKSPLIIHPDTTLLLPPRLFATVGSYAHLASYGHIVVDMSMRFDKRRKDTHRYTIASTHGPMDLTVPIMKPAHSSEANWTDIKVSTHGDWWNLHLTALESAYGRTPWFEYYIDSYLPLFRRRIPGEEDNLCDLIEEADRITHRHLGLETELTYRRGNSPLPAEKTYDARREEQPSSSLPYWQIRAAQLGFLPDMSILDLIFNCGPESPLVLQKIIKD